MEEWKKAIRLYKIELLKEKTKQEKLLERLQIRLAKLQTAKEIVLQLLNMDLSKINSDIIECKEIIEAHESLIEQTEDGSLDHPYSSDSD